MKKVMCIIILTVFMMAMVVNSSSARTHEDYTESVADWYPMKNVANPDLVRLADVLYSIIPQSEADQNRIYDYDSQQIWFVRCQESIYKYFDSRYNLLDFPYTREHSVISELQEFFDESEDESTIGLWRHYDLRRSFLTFLSIYIQNDELGCSKQEIHAWNQLHKILDEAVAEKLRKEFDGGSYATIAVEHRFIDILNARIEYLQDVEGYNLERDVESEYSLEEAKQRLFTKIDNTEISLSMKRQLKIALNKWLYETKCENCVSRFIGKLTDAFDEYDMEG